MREHHRGGGGRSWMAPRGAFLLGKAHLNEAFVTCAANLESAGRGNGTNFFHGGAGGFIPHVVRPGGVASSRGSISRRELCPVVPRLEIQDKGSCILAMGNGKYGYK